MNDTAPESVRESGGRPYGFWVTLVFLVLILVAFMLAQSAPLFADLSQSGWENVTEAELEAASFDGWSQSWGTIMGGVRAVLIVLSLVRWRRGMDTISYLALHPVGWKPVVFWIVVMFVIMTGLDLLFQALELPVIPDFMLRIFAGEQSLFLLVLLFLAVGVAAPVWEEVVFRGFVFESWRRTLLGPFGAIALSSLIFAVIHLQYEFYHLVAVFVAGCILGLSRHYTGSLWTPVYIHMFQNIVALVQTLVYLEFFV